jgi:hypothetical protein
MDESTTAARAEREALPDGTGGLIDLRDHRGRLTRLAIAAAIASIVTLIVLRAIGPAENPDPVAAGSVGMLAIGIFVVTTAAVLGVITAVHRRRR